jgi:glutathione S-transferase
MSELTLVAIPISHYCEKARWALDRAGIEYSEENHLQGFHHYYAKRRGGDWTTPVLCFGDGRPSIGQSNEILKWVDEQVDEELRLYPPDLASRIRATEHWLDATLGPDGRGWLYGHLLGDTEVIERYGLAGIPDLERNAFRGVFKVFKPYLKARLRVQGTRPDLQSIHDVFDEIAARISDGRPYLLGERFTAADLTFAALSAALVIPDRYGIPLPTIEELPSELSGEVERFRAHPAGQFALRLFAEERPTPQWLAARERAAALA